MTYIETAIFGGGCFWCTEAIFKMLKGVRAVAAGYSGEPKAEVIKIEFNPDEVSYRDLLTVFFASHDPTSINKQGADVGTDYRSVIFYTDEAQKVEAEKFIAELNASSKLGKPIVTDLERLEKFVNAEAYHQDFYSRNKDAPYCQIVINPKLEKVQKDFAELLKR